MASKNFIKDNFVLIVGLALPVLLMFGFMLASSLPNTLSDPPKYDLVFSIPDNSGAASIPLNVKLIVKDGVLKAQYIKSSATPPGYAYNNWKKLYIYEAKTQKVRELAFGFPADMDKMTGTTEETLEATQGLKLDTTLQSPDGYELSYDGYSHSGLLNEVFWGGGYSREPRLRKGNASIKLTTGDNRTYFYYSNVEFIGWVTGAN